MVIGRMAVWSFFQPHSFWYIQPSGFCLLYHPENNLWVIEKDIYIFFLKSLRISSTRHVGCFVKLTAGSTQFMNFCLRQRKHFNVNINFKTSYSIKQLFSFNLTTCWVGCNVILIFEILEKIIGTFEEGCQSSAHFSSSLFNSLLKPRLRHCFQALLSFIPSLIGVLFKSCCVLNYTIFFALVMEKLNLLRKELQTMTYSGLISGDYKSCSFSFLCRTFLSRTKWMPQL